jgi:hypothetical protein
MKRKDPVDSHAARPVPGAIDVTRPHPARMYDYYLGGKDNCAAGATEYIHADLRDTGTVLAQAAELLDFTRPVAVTLLAILHAMPDSDDPQRVVARLMDAVPSGSYLAISHTASDLPGQQAREGVRDVVDRLVQQDGAARSREQVAGFFDGMDLIEPGLVRVEEWRPEHETGTSNTVRSALWGAVARKP